MEKIKDFIIHRLIESRFCLSDPVENRFKSNWTKYCSKHWNQVFDDKRVVCCGSIACSSMKIYHQTEQSFQPNLNHSKRWWTIIYDYSLSLINSKKYFHFLFSSLDVESRNILDDSLTMRLNMNKSNKLLE